MNVVDWSNEPGVRTIADGFVLAMTATGTRQPVCGRCNLAMVDTSDGPTCTICGGRFPQAARRA